MPDGGNPGSCRPVNNWAQCLTGDCRDLEPPRIPRKVHPFFFGVATVLWPPAAKKSGKWYLRIIRAAGGLVGVETAYRGGGQEELSTPHQGSRYVNIGYKGTGGVIATAVCTPLSTNA